GLVVDTCVTQALGTAEREAAAAMATNLRRGATVGADKGYDTRGFVAALRSLGLTPHVAQHVTNRVSAIDARTTRHPGYAVSQQKRKLVEEVFGWLKTVALFRKTRHRGVRRVGWLFTLGAPQASGIPWRAPSSRLPDLSRSCPSVLGGVCSSVSPGISASC